MAKFFSVTIVPTPKDGRRIGFGTGGYHVLPVHPIFVHPISKLDNEKNWECMTFI